MARAKSRPALTYLEIPVPRVTTIVERQKESYRILTLAPLFIVT